MAAPQSIEDLYERKFAPMVRLARLLVGSPEVAADVVQDAFVELHRRWGTIRTPEAYLRQAAQTARQLTRSGDASALSWSNDGEWLAFSVRDAPGYEDYTTWITRADGTDARALTGMGDRFAWSPTGHRLVVGGYFCDSDRRGGVFLVDPGRDPRQLVASGSQILTVAWAPGGDMIGYTAASISGQADATSGTWVVGIDGADGARPRRLGDGELAAWSPDGRSLLVKEGSSVALVGVTDGDRHALGTSIAFDAQDPSAWSAFSPDGAIVAIVADVGTDASAGMSQSIVVCHTDGTACRRVTTIAADRISGTAFSPDGTEITFVGDQGAARRDDRRRRRPGARPTWTRSAARRRRRHSQHPRRRPERAGLVDRRSDPLPTRRRASHRRPRDGQGAAHCFSHRVLRQGSGEPRPTG
jgi:Tol biopolymer transport system component